VTTSGRAGTGGWVYRKNRAALLAENTICWLCGHPGARTADHVITHKDWPRTPDGRLAPGFDDLSNLRPAHGAMGAGRTVIHNRCQVCGELCNQSRGARRIVRPQTRKWL
jgi:5-methylcytosine-specific restriction endonuclease McrA